MRAGLESKMVKRGLAALLLSGLLLIAGATGAAADGYGSDCSDCPSPTVPEPDAPNYGPTYPVPSTPPAPGDETSAPPVLPRTGSSSAGLVGAGVGALVVGGGLVLVARRRKLGLHTT
jgi:LPXTG-motif cell wall-anchored protein